ncbi:MAG TPA: N-acetylmuramic acid 6-phosphate etherase [Capsulimonadaceae bacterium]|nr:N-acetylmuramic acid 6-phosphate etherase [Capsulimonadaceae bacterium]
MNPIDQLEDLTTEAVDPALSGIDTLTTTARLQLMNAEDAKVAQAVGEEIPAIARAVHKIVHSIKAGGRLIYVGAGTSGRLGVLDASECPPTFGTPPAMVQAIIAGGDRALREPIEGMEDDPEAGAMAIAECDAGPLDTVVGISASGRTPYVVGALHRASQRGAATVAVVNNRPSDMERVAGITIAPIVGPEVLAGSTRLKAGTSQKMVLNMLTTGAMVELGKTYGSFMVDVQATNNKLKARALRIVRQVTGASAAASSTALEDAGGNAKLAILLIESKLDPTEARGLLDENQGFLRGALADAQQAEPG